MLHSPLMKQRVFYITLIFKCASLLNVKNNACTDIEEYSSAETSSNCTYNPNVMSNMVSIIKRHGYGYTQFSVTTKTGYILNLFKIFSHQITKTIYPVFILHGLAINAEMWVAPGNLSLGFNLADAGYDVWIGTIRGTQNANKHKTLTTSDLDYWKFSLDDLVKEDVAAQLDFIANKTKKKILIIAHSMGTTLSFMYASEFSEKANRILRGIIALAPVGYLDGISLIDFIKSWVLSIISSLRKKKKAGLFYEEDTVHKFGINLCKSSPKACYNLLKFLSGSTTQFIPEHFLLLLSYWPSGISVFVLQHYMQIADNKRIQKYDYGDEYNMKVYGSKKPPVYNLSNVKIPVVLLYGKQDTFYNKNVIDRLYYELGSKKKAKIAIPVNQHPKYDFSHFDFVDSRNIVKFLYRPMFDIMKRFFV